MRFSLVVFLIKININTLFNDNILLFSSLHTCDLYPSQFDLNSHYRRSPGYGLVLAAETTNGVFLCAEVVANQKGAASGPSDAEEIGLEGAGLLMEEIFKVVMPTVVYVEWPVKPAETMYPLYAIYNCFFMISKIYLF